MYPTIVIVLVETQRSMMDLCEISPSNASTLGHHSFAAGPIDSAMDNKGKSLPSYTLQSQDVQERGLEILEIKFKGE